MMKRIFLFLFAVCLFVGVNAQAFAPITWTAYGLTFNAPKGILVEEDTEDTFLLNNSRFYISVQELDSDGMEQEDLNELVKGLADDDGVQEQSEVETFDLKQFHGVWLKGKADSDPCYYTCLMTKDAGSVFCICVIYNRVEAKVVERMLADAKDGRFAAADFDSFKKEYTARACAVSSRVCDFFYEFEKHLDDVNPALVASLAGEYSVQTGRDAMANGTRTGNGTGILLSGFGTAMDALTAVKEIVYEKRMMSLGELGALMAADWRGREDLRLRMLASKRKWGNNDAEVNRMAREISKSLSAVINTRLNLQKPTVISTNLTSAELRKTYSDRLTSRLTGEYLILPFYGTDVRKQKIQKTFCIAEKTVAGSLQRDTEPSLF